MIFYDMLASARRSEASYISDIDELKSRLKYLDMTFIGQYRDLSHQAILSKDYNNKIFLSISGTRFGKFNNIDIVDDIYLSPVNVGDGAIVCAGVYNGMKDFWDWVLRTTPPESIINVEGHSLGGERALLTPLFLPFSRIGSIFSFEAPRCASPGYWDLFKIELSGAIHTVNYCDIWYGWPMDASYAHPREKVYWLKNNSYEIINPEDWPGGLSLSDHNISSVISNIESIAMGMPPNKVLD